MKNSPQNTADIRIFLQCTDIRFCVRSGAAAGESVSVKVAVTYELPAPYDPLSKNMTSATKPEVLNNCSAARGGQSHGHGPPANRNCRDNLLTFECVVSEICRRTDNIATDRQTDRIQICWSQHSAPGQSNNWLNRLAEYHSLHALSRRTIASLTSIWKVYIFDILWIARSNRLQQPRVFD